MSMARKVWQPISAAMPASAAPIPDLAPDRYAIVIVGGRELVGSSSAFHQSRIAVALKHQVRHAPNVDLGYHVTKARRAPSINA